MTSRTEVCFHHHLHIPPLGQWLDGTRSLPYVEDVKWWSVSGYSIREALIHGIHGIHSLPVWSSVPSLWQLPKHDNRIFA